MIDCGIRSLKNLYKIRFPSATSNINKPRIGCFCLLLYILRIGRVFYSWYFQFILDLFHYFKWSILVKPESVGKMAYQHHILTSHPQRKTHFGSRVNHGRQLLGHNSTFVFIIKYENIQNQSNIEDVKLESLVNLELNQSLDGGVSKYKVINFWKTCDSKFPQIMVFWTLTLFLCQHHTAHAIADFAITLLKCIAFSFYENILLIHVSCLRWIVYDKLCSIKYSNGVMNRGGISSRIRWHWTKRIYVWLAIFSRFALTVTNLMISMLGCNWRKNTLTRLFFFSPSWLHHIFMLTWF